MFDTFDLVIPRRKCRPVGGFVWLIVLLQLFGYPDGSWGQLATAEHAILERIDASLNVLQDGSCRQDMNRTIQAVYNRDTWAMAMFDASVKFPDAVEHGSMYHFGSYDECLARMSGASLRTQFCLVRVALPGFRVRELATRDRSTTNHSAVQVRWGLCLPATCPADDVGRLLKETTGYSELVIPSGACQQQEVSSHRQPYDAAQIVTACVLLLFVLMVVFSTFYNFGCSAHETREMEKESTGASVRRAFSVLENLRKLAQDSKDEHGLGCINGIKAIAMIFILGGHALVFMAGGALLNPSFFREQNQMLQNAFLLNSPLLVDTFLLLSGFLFARLLLLELDKRKGRINVLLLYVFRYIRLTPAYLAIIALYATWLPRLGDGPLWNERMQLEQHRCQVSWWRNLLYINNYVGTEEVCMFQSWYLATDTQLFVLAPLILYPMWRYGHRVALLLLGSLTGVSILVPFFVTYYRQLDPTLMIFTDEISDLQSNDYFVNVYGKTHLRATAYLFGLLAGYLVHWMQMESIRIGRKMLGICWTISTVCGCLAMFSLTAFYNGLGTENYLYNAVYAALHRFGWSLSNGWLILACVTGHGDILKRFLSWRAFVPLSRLTYCAYLMNGLVELYLSATRRTPLYASVSSLTAESISHMTLTFLLALVLCLLFESPIHGLEKIALKRFRPIQSPDGPETSSLSTTNTQSTSEEA
ncbi:nose resistant to fluoxetine protein 6-like [Anopheles ziemanni]|uniref:nose resistant to fluoxetine protein 6-like n=1 Tax=Anopheles coustani TaxID=139045 RepID=UPI00265AAB96|nr:nose resistant to fluoxetine protein 6-like [Anopheles coustani]XP_058174909.1 nose resistant to fluoxetine protein 6-like [Anopheles ziemanni]